MLSTIEPMNALPPTFECHPLSFNPRDTSSRQALAQLFAEGKVRETFDTILQQLRDLASVRHPFRKPTREELSKAVAELQGACPLEDYGRWVYYPWTGRLVHLLERDEFREVRLNRNRNKITLAEQSRLDRITVGIVGLSVGNAVARSLAIEGVGTIKLADFDRLDLSNLNRLQAGVQDIGVNKAVLAARQISELDPDTQVYLFSEGITLENLDEFLLGEPAVDILVDECDSLDVKVLLRERARQLHRPVLMETSDRGMLDVERFDLEPQYPLFHGLTGELRSEDLHGLTTEQKIAVVLRIIGTSTMSTRLAASMIEIGRTLGTWPQLGADVTLGGATVAAAVRRIALGQSMPSGRRYIDLDRNLAGGGGPAVDANITTLAAMPAANSDLSGVSPLLQFLVEQAVLAPSGGNCQPWRFYAEGENTLHVIHDRSRSENLLDRTFQASRLALGAAIENIVIAAAHRGQKTVVDRFPARYDSSWVATLRFEASDHPSLQAEASYFPQIARRVTNRRKAEPTPLDEASVSALMASATERGGSLQVLTERDALTEIGQILGEADRVRFLCAEMHQELMKEVRWTPHEIEETRDGIGIDSLELTETEIAVMRVLARQDVVAHLREVDLGTGIVEISKQAMEGACAVGLLHAHDDEAPSFFEAGRALQCVWLTASALGLGFQPMTACLFMFRMLRSPAGEIFLKRERQQLQRLEERLSRVFPTSSGTPALLFRLTRSTEVSARALRRPVSDVLFAGQPSAR